MRERHRFDHVSQEKEINSWNVRVKLVLRSGKVVEAKLRGGICAFLIMSST
jgi:hypothetical protein